LPNPKAKNLPTDRRHRRSLSQNLWLLPHLQLHLQLQLHLRLHLQVRRLRSQRRMEGVLPEKRKTQDAGGLSSLPVPPGLARASNASVCAKSSIFASKNNLGDRLRAGAVAPPDERLVRAEVSLTHVASVATLSIARSAQWPQRISLGLFGCPVKSGSPNLPSRPASKLR
jgi:hypothetical protein